MTIVDILSFEDPAGFHRIAWDPRVASVGSPFVSGVSMLQPLSTSSSSKQGACSSDNPPKAPAILPLGQPHGTHAHAGFSSHIPIGSRRIVQFPAQACLSFITVDLSPRVRGSTQVGPTISAIWVRRELENPSTRRAPKLLEDYQGPACLLRRLFSKPPR